MGAQRAGEKEICLVTVAHSQLFVAKGAAFSRALYNLCFIFKIML